MCNKCKKKKKNDSPNIVGRLSAVFLTYRISLNTYPYPQLSFNPKWGGGGRSDEDRRNGTVAETKNIFRLEFLPSVSFFLSGLVCVTGLYGPFTERNSQILFV